MLEIVLSLIAVFCIWFSIQMFKKQKQMNAQRKVEQEERQKQRDNTEIRETHATGVQHYMKAVDGIVQELRDKYGDEIDGSPLACQMVAEPENKYDSNAIRIEVSTNVVVWYAIGYVPKKDISLVREGMEQGCSFNAEYNFREDYEQPHQFDVWWKVQK